MADIVFVAIALAFFGLAFLYVLGCDRIIGRETPPAGGRRRNGPRRRCGRSDGSGGDVVSWENALALIISIPVAVYLVAALLFPERF